MIYFCKRCQQRFLVSDDTKDFVHICNAPSSAVNNEDIANVGAWSDYTGSGGAVTKLSYLGITNKIAGTRGHLQFKARSTQKTKRGNNAQIFRERQHEEFQEL